MAARFRVSHDDWAWPFVLGALVAVLMGAVSVDMVGIREPVDPLRED